MSASEQVSPAELSESTEGAAGATQVVRGRRGLPAWVVGVCGGLATIGLATVLAGLAFATGMSSGTGLYASVGSAFIDRTPLWLKDFAVNVFGTSDKLALLVGMGIVLTVISALIGWATARWRVIGLVAFAVLGAIGLGAVMTRANAQPVDGLIVMLGVLAGLAVLAFGIPGGAQATADATSGTDQEPTGLRAPDRRTVFAGAAGVAATLAGSRLVSPAATPLEVPASSLQIASRVSVPAAASIGVEGVAPFIVPNQDFYRIDTALVVPSVDRNAWSLKVTGMVEREVTITWDDLTKRGMREALVTLACVSNEVGGDLVGNAVWTGWPIRELLALAGPKSGADMVLQTSVDGWTCGTPLTALTDDRNALLAVLMNGEPLPREHGYPVRSVVPGLYGYTSACKWVTEMKVTTFAQDVGYWTPLGWSAQAPVKTASRIDTPRNGSAVPAGTVMLGGVAWAMHRGISKVEVQIDDQPWATATLADEPTIDSWRQWKYAWQATSGSHTVRVRATDGTGAVQTSASAPPAPDGATGLHTITMRVD